MSTANEVSEVLKYCRENLCTPDGKRVCFVCGHEPEAGEEVAVGIFVADEAHQTRLGAPHDKTRLLIYVLCADCHDLPDRNERVEKKIFTVASVQ